MAVSCVAREQGHVAALLAMTTLGVQGTAQGGSPLKLNF